MTLRCLYDPRYDPRPPDGHALPEGDSDEVLAERERLRQAIADDTPKPLWGGPGDHQDIIEERLRALTIAERIEVEIRLSERVKDLYTFDYDPLKY